MEHRKRGKLTSEGQQLAAKYLPLAENMARKRPFDTETDHEERRGAAALGLTQAAESYDPTLGSFGRHARTRIAGALVEHEQRKRPVPFRRPYRPEPQVLTNRDSVIRLTTAREPHVGHALEEADELEHYLRKLPPPQRAALEAVALDGESTPAAARRLGCTTPTVCRRFRLAFEQLHAAARHDQARADAAVEQTHVDIC
jgi:RNA polymerase sigma factor (sigma-70 family)